jgi:hypothetical protein
LGDREMIKTARDWALKVVVDSKKYLQILKNFKKPNQVHWE